MRIAYFIMLHHKPQQFEWLFNAIYNETDFFVIHVDLKSIFNFKGRGGTYSRVKELTRGRSNVVLMTPQYTNWGGWSLSRIALKAIHIALSHGSHWDYFINLSGECYPIKRMEIIREQLARDPTLNYIETRHFSSLPPDAWHPKRAIVVETPVKIVILPGQRSAPKSFTLMHKGSQWVMLTRAFCEWQHSAPVRQKIRQYMKFSPLSDEMIFQALLLNGPFSHLQAPDYKREVKFVEPNAHAEVFNLSDLARLQCSSAFFARKFDLVADMPVLRHLASSLGFSPGPDLNNPEPSFKS